MDKGRDAKMAVKDYMKKTTWMSNAAELWQEDIRAPHGLLPQHEAECLLENIFAEQIRA